MPEKTKPIKNARTTPHNLEAEQSILGCILLGTLDALDIVNKLTEDDFFSQTHKVIISAMKAVSLANKPLDFVTIADELDREGNMSLIGGIGYLSTLSNIVPSTANYSYYLEIVKRDSTMRKLINSCSTIIEDCYSSDDREKSLAQAEKLIYDVNSENLSGTLNNLKDNVGEVINKFNAIHKDANAFKGIPTGFQMFDKITNGLHGGDLIVLAARPGMGKTSLAMNMVEYAAINGGYSCAVFSLEMPKVQIAQRMLCSLAGVSMSKALSGGLKQQDWLDLWNASDIINRTNIYIDDSSLITPAEILSKCRRLKNKTGLDLIMVDYIQLMTSDNKKADNRQQEVSEITRNLKIIAKELNCPIIALSQLSRTVEGRTIKKPQLSDLRESGAIEQDADMVMFIYKPEEEESEAEDSKAVNVELIIAKHRNGEQGTIPLSWIGEIVRFRDTDENGQAIIRQYNKLQADKKKKSKQPEKLQTSPQNLGSDSYEEVPPPTEPTI